MTVDAEAAVRAEIASLEGAAVGSGSAPGAPLEVGRTGDAAARRLRALRAVLEARRRPAGPGTAAIGRCVVIVDDAGRVVAYRLVLPSDGAPELGWLAADTPLGIALLDRRAGEQVVVHAPGGSWEARVMHVD